MATQKPRITVTLTPRQHEVLRSISESSGQPMSAFLSEMLEVSMPTLERMATTFQKLRKAQTVERERYLQSMDETQDVLEGIAQQAMGQFDLFMTAIEDSATGETDAAEPRRHPRRTIPAPATNRGATDPLAEGRKPKRSKARSPVHQEPILKKTTPAKRHKKGVAE